MMPIAQTRRVAPAGTDTTRNESGFLSQDSPFILPATDENNDSAPIFPLLEMDEQASRARMSLVAGRDFWHEKDEERERMEQLRRLRAWTWKVLHRRIWTQEDRRRFRTRYALVLAAGEER